jgi:hypothetical protein
MVLADMRAWHKTIYFILILSLVYIENREITKDRTEFAKLEREKRTEQNEKFQHIADELNSSMLDNRRHFDTITDNVQKNLQKTTGLLKEVKAVQLQNEEIKGDFPPPLRQRTLALINDLQVFVDHWRKDLPDYANYAKLPDAQTKYLEASSASQRDMLLKFKDSNLAAAVAATVQELQIAMAFNNRQCGPASMTSLRDIDDCKGALKLALMSPKLKK